MIFAINSTYEIEIIWEVVVAVYVLIEVFMTT